MRKTGRPKRVDWPKCKVDGCNKTSEGGAKGMCSAHYMAARRGRVDPDSGEHLRPKKRVQSYGEGARCLVPDCPRRPKGRGLCTMHYQQWQAGEDLGTQVPSRGHKKEAVSYRHATCRVRGCSQRPVNRWMCSKHTQQREAGIIDEDGNQLRELRHGRERKEKWIGQDGYILIKAPKGHPTARYDGSILEHRLVMEEAVGRYLEPHEIVHHKDGNPSNNHPDNLQLLDGRKGTSTRHPPGHEVDMLHAAQVLLQQEDIPKSTKRAIERYAKKKK